MRRRCARRESRGGLTDSATPVVGLGIRAAIASSSAIAYIPMCQPFRPHLYRLRHTAVAAAAPAMIFRVLRRSTVVVIAIVRNRSCDATAAATVQHCRRSSSSQPHTPSLALSGTRGTTAATVQRRRSSQPHALSLALSGTRGTTAATVQRRSSSQPHAPSLALSGTRGTTAATVQRRSSSQALYRYATSDGCNHLAGLSPSTVVISDSAFEEWLQSDNMEMPMFSQSERPQQSASTAATLTAAAPAAEAVTGTRVFPAGSSKGVAEAPASSAGAAPGAVPAAAPATGGTVFPTASVGGAARAPASADATVVLTAALATGGTVPSATSVGGAPASSAVAAASAEISAAEPATSGTVPSAASVREAVGARESSAGAVSSDAATEGTPSTRGTAAPAASTAREARELASAAGSAGEICVERGASTHPFDHGTVFPLEVRHSSDERARHNSSNGGSSSSSSNDNTNDHDSWWDATCVGALQRPFDPGKRCRRSTRRGKAVLGVDLPFDRGKGWERMQHGG